MGGSTSKQEGKHENNSGGKSTSTREEIDERKYERDVMVSGLKEAEAKWRKERKRLKEEVKRLRKKAEEKEERVREMVVGGKCGEDDEVGWELVVEQMNVERAIRDEAVERWKQLYLAIKTELDLLIQRTHGEGLYWKAEEEDMTMMMEELKKELKEKKGVIETLKERIASMERGQYEKEREIDILRQSLRIISSSSSSKRQKKKQQHRAPTASKNLPMFAKKCVGSI